MSEIFNFILGCAGLAVAAFSIAFGWYFGKNIGNNL